MKRILSIICCIVCINSFSQSPINAEAGTPKTSGERVLIKAIAAIVNPEGNKKTPVKTTCVYSLECL